MWALKVCNGSPSGLVLRGLNERQRGYAQVKRELWGIILAVKDDKDYLIGNKVIIEMDCLTILGMISTCATPNLAMLRWIVYIKSLSPKIRHIYEKDNSMDDMLSRAWYDNENDMVSEGRKLGRTFSSRLGCR